MNSILVVERLEEDCAVCEITIDGEIRQVILPQSFFDGVCGVAEGDTFEIEYPADGEIRFLQKQDDWKEKRRSENRARLASLFKKKQSLE